MALSVNEIFFSIQGESVYAGIPCVFVRLTGCNLRCTYCDTTYAWEDGISMEIGQIIEEIRGFRCNLVEVTGGEPLIQKETPFLINELLKTGYKVLLETNGTIDIRMVPPECIKIVDIKCPSSNEKNKTDLNNIKHLGANDQIKFVIQNREDYLYAKNIFKTSCKQMEGGNILFSPVTGRLPPSDLAGWILNDRIDVRFHLQLHKIIWPEVRRGV
ncbi:MAG: radical SAM protein [Deltaproteobacteria bacterium]|nr:radical SAM protein [Deltaproteobacteria bacterium]